MSDQGTATSTRDTAQRAAADTANTAAEQAKAVSGTAADQAKKVADEASSQMATLSSQAKDHASSVLSSSSDELHQQLGDRLGRASSMARERSAQLQALAEGRVDDAGPLKDWASEASQRLRRLADRADELGPRGVVEEVSDFARRRPAAFLVGAGLAGIVVGRLARAGKEVSGSNGSGTSSMTGSQAASLSYGNGLAGDGAGDSAREPVIIDDPIGATGASPQTTTPGAGTLPGGPSQTTTPGSETLPGGSS